MIFNKKDTTEVNIDMSRIPTHIAIIMDGNGRYAKKRGLPRSAGHTVGAKKFREIAGICKDIGVKYLTVYAFSTENWKRPLEEVNAIMGLFKDYLEEAKEKLIDENIRVNFIGDTSAFDEELRELIAEVSAMNDNESALVVNFAANYGGRDEIVRAAKLSFLEKGEDITADDIDKHLYTATMPEPELIIRPGGERRLSNFLLWQSSYSELYFCDILWPDFTKDDLFDAIIDFQKRNRRYGGI